MKTKEIKVEWCENFIKALFNKHFPYADGIATFVFWALAEQSGLWEKGTYGSPMSQALSNLTKVDNITHEGKLCYSVFRLKSNNERSDYNGLRMGA